MEKCESWGGAGNAADVSLVSADRYIRLLEDNTLLKFLDPVAMEAEEEQLAARQVVCFYINSNVDKVAVRRQAAKILETEWAIRGVPEGLLSEEEASDQQHRLAAAEKRVESVWIGNETNSGRPFGIITFAEAVDAGDVYGAHVVRKGPLHAVMGQRAGFSVGQARHQRTGWKTSKGNQEGSGRREAGYGGGRQDGVGGSVGGSAVVTEEMVRKVAQEVTATVTAQVLKALEERERRVKVA